MESPHVKELLKKMLELEESHEQLMQETSKLKVSRELRKRSPSASPRPHARRNMKESLFQDSMNLRSGVRGGGHSADKYYLKILQSMAQSVHALDLNMRIIFWNAMAEKLYGYSAAEVVGKNPINVMVDNRDAAFAMNVARLCSKGEIWTGEFPVKGKTGQKFLAVTTCSPFYDDDGSLVGIVSLTSNTAPYLHPRISLPKLKAQEVETSSISAKNSFASRLGLDSKEAFISKLGLDSDQPIQVAIASKISDLASKVRSKMLAGDSSVTLSKGGSGDSHHRDHGLVSASLSNHMDNAASGGANTPRGDFIPSPFGVFTYKDDKFTPKPLKDPVMESLQSVRASPFKGF